ncbi:MAG: GNAT family N-acetyltransferase [Gemmatimonadetes bacterium]|nr:GNAT family N-acetyltransferase [Gemmatimonadota bacterium]
MKLTIEPARPEDAARLTGIVLRSKRHWGYPDELIEQWRDDLTITPDYIRRAQVLVARNAEHLAGVSALVRTGTDWELEHLWVDPDHMGTGAGRALFERAVATVRSAGGRGFKIVADPNAEPFYLHMGARRTGDVPAQPAGRRLPVLHYPDEESNEQEGTA